MAEETAEQKLARLEAENKALREQVEQMQHQLAEAHERIDFTERLLSQARAPEPLPRSTQ